MTNRDNIFCLCSSYSMCCSACDSKNLNLKEDSFGNKWVQCSRCGIEIRTLGWFSKEDNEVNDESNTD